MIVGGDVVDDLIGSTFHLSTLACAAWANTFADVFGMSVGSTVNPVSSFLSVLTQLAPAQPMIGLHHTREVCCAPGDTTYLTSRVYRNG